jgi:hypothetical protein
METPEDKKTSLLDMIEPGSMIMFIYQAENSKAGQPTQSVTLKVSQCNSSYIKGINPHRLLDLGEGKAFRTYLWSRIVPGTLWIKAY